MAKHEFKVGDRVQFKEWDEMEKEFGLDFQGAIRCHVRFNASVRHLCGTYATIKEICRDGTVSLSEFSAKGNKYWLYHVDMLKPASAKKQKKDKPTEHPTITAHLIEGNKTTVMLSDGRIGEVTCYYKDTFDPAVGVAEAYKKALDITKAEDKPKPKFEIGKKYVLPAVQKVVIEISNIDDRTGVYTYRIFDTNLYLSFRENGEFYNALIPYGD